MHYILISILWCLTNSHDKITGLCKKYIYIAKTFDQDIAHPYTCNHNFYNKIVAKDNFCHIFFHKCTTAIESTIKNLTNVLVQVDIHATVVTADMTWTTYNHTPYTWFSTTQHILSRHISLLLWKSREHLFKNIFMHILRIKTCLPLMTRRSQVSSKVSFQLSKTI